MSFFYFFEKDSRCEWIGKEIDEAFPKYLHEPIDFNGKKVKFYMILSWILRKDRGANLKWLNEIGVNYVNIIDDLPKNSGVYITGYDSDIDELKMLIEKNVPIIDHACPWVRQFKKQLLKINPVTHQAVILIDKEHMVYDCYKKYFPEDSILINEYNYEAEIKNNYNNKPIYLLVYTVFRKKDSINIINFINNNYNHPDNILFGYKKTSCKWIKQGLIEEIEEKIPEKNLNHVWIICSSENDRSTRSIINEVKEQGAKPVIIKKDNEIPNEINSEDRIGVLFAPIPLHHEAVRIKKLIRDKFMSYV